MVSGQPDARELLGPTLPHLPPERVVEVASGRAGCSVAAYVLDVDGSCALRLAGDRDRFPERIRVRSAARAVVIDLEDVSMIDSSGIALLLNAFRRLDHAGRQLAIACPMGSPRRAFELTALDRQLPMHETRRDALAAIGAS